MHVESLTGEHFTLDKSFNRGGEAEIWSVHHDPHLVAKIYHQPTSEQEAKLVTMIARSPRQSSTHPAVAWPLHLLYKKRRFVGYLMPRVNESRPIFHFYNPARRVQLATGYPWRYFLHRTAQNLAAAVQLVHDQGHIIGDLNESNVLVNREALVTLVDSDSFQVEGGAAANSNVNQIAGNSVPTRIYRSMVGKAEFTPPELHGVDFKSIDRTPAHDNFSLAIMIFYLLMEGYHPFAGVMTDDVTKGQSIGRVDLYGIRNGFFPHARTTPLQPPPRSPKFMWLEPDLQRAFLRTFVEGHTQPNLRTTANEWRTLLEQAESALQQCPATDKHVFSRHLRRCPHCERTAIPPLSEVELAKVELANGGVAATMPPSTGWMGTVPGKLSSRLSGTIPTEWQPVFAYIQRGVLWMWRQRVQLRQRTERQYATTQAILSTIPEQLQRVRYAVHHYASLWQRWIIGHVVGVPTGGVLALGFYNLTEVVSGSMTVPLPLSPGWMWVLMAAIFAGTFGIAQAWALQHVLLRWSYLRELWVGVATLTGALLGITIARLVEPSFFTTVQLMTDAIFEPTSTLTAWSLLHLQMSGLTLLFGATLGFLQSFLLRQQMPRADDGRIWTVVNGIAWLMVMEGILLGAKLGNSWDLSAWPLPDMMPSQSGIWLGVFLGSSLGLFAATLFTGGVLLWLLQGPRRSVYWPRFAMQIVQYRRFPRQLSQQVRDSGKRWGRALVLLVLIALLIEGMWAFG